MSRHFFTDTAHGQLHYVGDSVTVEGDNDVSASDLETVTLDSKWNDFFDTDEYVQFEATVAQPIVQPYFYDGELHYFRKDETELQQAQAQLNNLPWTVKHPPKDRITTADQIRGFWSDAHYDGGQKATVNIPANDTDAVRFAVDNGDVSIGFSGTLDWVDDSDTKTDAVQRDMAYDHVASVENGRCPPERGCGLHTDSPSVGPNNQQHGHVTDAVQTKLTEEGDKTEAREERAEYRYETRESAANAAEELNCADGESIEDYTHSHDTPDGTVYMPCSSHGVFRRAFDRERGAEFTYDTTLGDDISEEQTEAIETLRAEHDEMDGSEISPNLSTLKEVYERGAAAWQQSHAPGANQQQWALARVREFLKDLRNGNALNSGADNDLAPDGYNPPSADADDVTGGTLDCSAVCSPGPCSCGLHDPFIDVQVNGEDVDLVPPEAAQNAAQQALDARDDDGVTVNGMTDHGWSRAEQLASGEELSPSDIVGSTGAMAPWWSRHASHTIDGDSLAGSDAENPWQDNSYTAGKGWGGVAGYKWAIRKGNEIKRARGEDPTYEMADTDIAIPDFDDGDMVRHRYIEDVNGYVAHNPSDRPYVMVDPIVDGQRNSHTMTFGTADIELVSKADGGSEMREESFGDATTVMDTITYEDTMGGDLDESEIPNEGYEPHYVFDADTKSDSSFPLVDADGNLRRENVIAAASYSKDAPDEDFLMDVLREVNEAFDEPPLDEETVSTDTAPLAKHRVLADAAPTDDTMTKIQTFIDENDLTVADVIDALDVELEAIDGVPTEPTAFYDGEPDIEDLADDFPAVKMLADDKTDLEAEVDSLREDLRETKRPRYEEKVEELTSIADDAFGNEDDLLDAFDADDEDERLTIDDIEDKIETAKTIRGADTTTAADSASGDDEDIDVDTTVSVADEDSIRSTEGGKLDLSSVRN